MKRPIILLWRLLLDAEGQSLDSITKDFQYAESRMKREGMSFLTITLPRLDDALLKGLSSGFVTPKDFSGFKPRYRGGTLPAFLQGLFTKVFHDDGSLRIDASPQAIADIRQITRLFKKVELPCSDRRIKAGYERYISNDERVQSWNREFKRFLAREVTAEDSERSSTVVPHRRPSWRATCGYLWSGLEDLGSSLYCSRGTFGPGVTAEKLQLNERWTVKQWPERSEASFPVCYHALSREDSDDLSKIRFIPPSLEQPVRVVQVPKTLLSPRTISVEPSYMMLMQQSVNRPLMAYLESDWKFSGSIGFTDQSVNRERARIGSIDGGLATIDLKDASDMVPLELVKDIFGGVAPTFLDLILDSRSTKAQLPDGTIISLAKFASMGSALCFPIEAMVFFTITCYAIVDHLGQRPSLALLDEISKRVVVYGDDIIVPTEWANPVMACLERHNLVVNRDKSFTTGLFRESCGGDYYKGYDVTPSYVRHVDKRGSHMSTSTLVGAVSLANQFYLKGYWNAASYLREEVERDLGYRLPQTTDPIGGLAWHSVFRNSALKYDGRLHKYRTKVPYVTIKKRFDQPSTLSGFMLLADSSRGEQRFEAPARDRRVEGLSKFLGSPSNIRMVPAVSGPYRPGCESPTFARSSDRVSGSSYPSTGKRGKVGCELHNFPRSRSISLDLSSSELGYCLSLEESQRNSYENRCEGGYESPHLQAKYHCKSPSYGSDQATCSVGSVSSEEFDWRELIIHFHKEMLASMDKPIRGRSLNESVVRYATSLKRKWTATQAGLTW